MVDYANDTTINAVVPIPLSLNYKKTKSMVVGRSRINATGYGDLTLGGAEHEEAKSPRIRAVILDSKLTSETSLR